MTALLFQICLNTVGFLSNLFSQPLFLLSNCILVKNTNIGPEFLQFRHNTVWVFYNFNKVLLPTLSHFHIEKTKSFSFS